MYYIAIPRSLRVVNEQHGVWDVVKDATGGVRSFDTLGDAKQYVEDNDLETNSPTYYIMSLVG